jgi:hypothetical protein
MGAPYHSPARTSYRIRNHTINMFPVDDYEQISSVVTANALVWLKLSALEKLISDLVRSLRERKSQRVFGLSRNCRLVHFHQTLNEVARWQTFET